MVKKERPKRVFRRGKKPLGKTSGKIREKRGVEAVQDVQKGKTPFYAEFPKIYQLIPDIQKEASLQFPKIVRKITEIQQHIQIPQLKGVRYVWLGAIVVGVILCLWQLLLFVDVSPKFFKLLSQRTILEAKLKTWESISNHYSYYRDAHIEIALLAYRLGKKDLVESEVKKILEIDPNFSLSAEFR